MEKESCYWVIESETQYEDYLKILETLLWGLESPTPIQDKEIKLLTTLIEIWEEENYSFTKNVNIDPIQLLKCLIDDHKISVKNLSELLFVTEEEINDILNYKIYLSKPIIKRLCERFKMREEAFDREYPLQKEQFEIGKAYQHNSGIQMYICGIADTIYNGKCFIAEEGWHREKLQERLKTAKENNEKMPSTGFDTKGLIPISMDSGAMENWFEISKNEFIKHNTY